MLIAIYGMFAAGKTYAMTNNLDHMAQACNPDFKLTVVTADTKTIYNYRRKQAAWERLTGSRDTWKGEQTGKIAILQRMIAERNRVWVVESARFFGGMGPTIIDAYHNADGGLVFIIPTVTEAVGLQFLKERAALAGKAFREDYWDAKRLEYECRNRYMNAMNTHYIPQGVPVYEFSIDYARTNWTKALAKICEVLGWGLDDWYGAGAKHNQYSRTNPMPVNLKRVEEIEDDWSDYYYETKGGSNQGQQRQRQDDYREAAHSSIQRHPRTARQAD